MLQPGVVLQGRYEIVRLIGQGGMGAVYEARDLRLGNSTVALKQALFNSEQLKQAFEREANLLATLSHPNLPKVRDQFTDANGMYLVMEYISGSDLSKVLSDRGSALPLDQVMRFADQLLDALEYIHEHQPPIIHRDIKPENIKLTSRGQIMLIDFGLAKDLGGVSVIAYSAAYAPLEQLKARGTDSRSDLYALGATLYRLLTGRLPASAVDRIEVMANTGNDPLRAPHDLSLAIPVAVGEALMRSLEIDRENRFQSAAEMREALKRAVSSFPPQPQQAAPISDLPTMITSSGPGGSGGPSVRNEGRTPSQPADQRSQVRSHPSQPQPPPPQPSYPQPSRPPDMRSDVRGYPQPPQPTGPPVQMPPPGWDPRSGGQRMGYPPPYGTPTGAPKKKTPWGFIIFAAIVVFFMLACGFLGLLGSFSE
jgi:serine/threonine protein kinase